MSCFLFADSENRQRESVEMLRAMARIKISPGLNCLENVSMGRRDFSGEVESDFLLLFKRRPKIK